MKDLEVQGLPKIMINDKPLVSPKASNNYSTRKKSNHYGYHGRSKSLLPEIRPLTRQKINVCVTHEKTNAEFNRVKTNLVPTRQKSDLGLPQENTTLGVKRETSNVVARSPRPGLGRRSKTYIRSPKHRQRKLSSFTRAECTSAISKILEELSEKNTKIQEKYNALLHHLPDLLFTLKLINPNNLERFMNLNDVQACHDYLVQSQSIGKIVHTDLITDFLNIVRQILNTTYSIQGKMIRFSDHLHRYITSEDSALYRTAMGSLLLLLEPRCDFSDLPVNKIHLLKIPLLTGVMDNKLFAGLACYIPALIVTQDEMIAGLENIWKQLKRDAGRSKPRV